jgi:hypothetical protein
VNTVLFDQASLLGCHLADAKTAPLVVWDPGLAQIPSGLLDQCVFSTTP